MEKGGRGRSSGKDKRFFYQHRGYISQPAHNHPIIKHYVHMLMSTSPAVFESMRFFSRVHRFVSTRLFGGALKSAAHRRTWLRLEGKTRASLGHESSDSDRCCQFSLNIQFTLKESSVALQKDRRLIREQDRGSVYPEIRKEKIKTSLRVEVIGTKI